MILKILKSYWPTIIVVAVIIYATWIPKPLADYSLKGIPHIDKLIHAVMFGGLAGAAMFDYYRQRVGNPLGHRQLSFRVILAVSCLVAAFGVVDETVQGLLDIGRPSDPFDMLANFTGILVAAFVAPPVIRSVVRN